MSANEMKMTYSAPEVSQYLGISRTRAYALMNEKGFPSFRVGSRVMVMKTAFDRWIEEQMQK